MRIYLFIFILCEILISLFFYKQYTSKLDIHHQNILKSIDNSFSSTINTFELINDDFHSIHSFDLAKLLTIANDANTTLRDDVREKLLKKFMGFYSNKKLYSLEGMHVFDKHGNSLLRFHEPDKHDDPIVKLRVSAQKMLKDFSYMKGLEVGVYKESYRFIYPLFYNGEFVGSYEYSISLKSIVHEMKKFYGENYLVLYFESEVQRVVDKKYIRQRYSKIKINDKVYYYLKQTKRDILDIEKFKSIFQKYDLSHQFENGGVLDCDYKHESLSIGVKHIKDIDANTVAYLLVDLKDQKVCEYRDEMIIHILFATLFSLMLYLYVIKQIKNRIYVRNLVNIQKEMLLVTDGISIKDTNNALLNYFHYETLEDFIQEHSCVCDFFVQEEGYLQKEKYGVSWLEHMLNHPEHKHIVKMKNITTQEYNQFEITSEKLTDSEFYFIVFRDITNEIQEHDELLDRVNHDILTGIHNRASFESQLENELQKSSRTQEGFSLVMFDIDHFKNINDTYGHDIGDVVLKEITALVSTHIRNIDFFARWGGEEFMIISLTKLEKTEEFAEKLRVVIENNDFSNVGRVTCSFGVTQYHQNDTHEKIIKRVDNMLYSAKNSGRNSVVSMR